MRRVAGSALLALVLAGGRGEATSIKDVKLAELFQEADVVALVSIEAADARVFKDAVYRATVSEGFKGVATDATIYFGPYVSYRLGGDYVVFLKNGQQRLKETLLNGANPWPEGADDSLLRIMYAGYSVLPVEFTCAFPDCAYGVSIPSNQVIFPADVTLVHDGCKPGSNYDSWITKDGFLKLLRGLSPATSPRHEK